MNKPQQICIEMLWASGRAISLALPWKCALPWNLLKSFVKDKPKLKIAHFSDIFLLFGC